VVALSLVLLCALCFAVGGVLRFHLGDRDGAPTGLMSAASMIGLLSLPTLVPLTAAVALVVLRLRGLARRVRLLWWTTIAVSGSVVLYAALPPGAAVVTWLLD
jgi:hypothetical protein